MRVNLRDIAQAAAFDPERAIRDALGDISGVEIFHHHILVATYIEPEVTSGGIIKPDNTLAQNRFQGKAALVLLCGPNAFRDDGTTSFGGITVAPGDWVFARPADGMEVFIGGAGATSGVSCRIFADKDIYGRLPHPSMVY